MLGSSNVRITVNTLMYTTIISICNVAAVLEISIKIY